MESRDWVWLVVHGLIGVWGVADLLFGYALFRVLVGAFGAICGAMLGTWIGGALTPEAWALMVGGVVGAIAGGALAWMVWLGGVGLLGAAAAATLLMPGAQARFEAPWADVVVLVGGIVGGFAAILSAKPLIVVCTAITGAFRAVYGWGFVFLAGPNLFLLGREAAAAEAAGKADAASGFASALVATTPWPYWVVPVVALVGVIAQARPAWQERHKEDA